MFRLGTLVVFLVLAATLHGRGSTYNALHIVYFVILAGVLIATVAWRGRGGGRGGSRGGASGRDGQGRARLGGGSFGSGPLGSDRPVDNPDPEAGP